MTSYRWAPLYYLLWKIGKPQKKNVKQRVKLCVNLMMFVHSVKENLQLMVD